MGLSFRKGIKIGKNTRINLSKNGGVGVSTGIKGARVSVNKKGVRTTVSKDGIQYRKDKSFGSNKGNDIDIEKLKDENIENESIISIIGELIKGLLGIGFFGFLLYLIIKFIIIVINS